MARIDLGVDGGWVRDQPMADAVNAVVLAGIRALEQTDAPPRTRPQKKARPPAEAEIGLSSLGPGLQHILDKRLRLPEELP